LTLAVFRAIVSAGLGGHMDTITLDERIRDLATIECKAEVQRIMRPIYDLVTPIQYTESNLRHSGDKKAYILAAFSQLEDEVVKALLPRWQNQAVENFIEKIKEISARVDDIENVTRNLEV
jgi:hypothetical protein